MGFLNTDTYKVKERCLPISTNIQIQRLKKVRITTINSLIQKGEWKPQCISCFKTILKTWNFAMYSILDSSSALMAPYSSLWWLDSIINIVLSFLLFFLFFPIRPLSNELFKNKTLLICFFSVQSCWPRILIVSWIVFISLSTDGSVVVVAVVVCQYSYELCILSVYLISANAIFYSHIRLFFRNSCPSRLKYSYFSALGNSKSDNVVCCFPWYF